MSKKVKGISLCFSLPCRSGMSSVAQELNVPLKYLSLFTTPLLLRGCQWQETVADNCGRKL